jgi:hypothetical protein
MNFPMIYWLLEAIVIKTFSDINFKTRNFYADFIIRCCKNIFFDRLQNVFSFGRIFFPKFAGIPVWDLATVKHDGQKVRQYN